MHVYMLTSITEHVRNSRNQAYIFGLLPPVGTFVYKHVQHTDSLCIFIACTTCNEIMHIIKMGANALMVSM